MGSSTQSGQPKDPNDSGSNRATDKPRAPAHRRRSAKPPRQRLPAAQRRALILEAALEVFAERGFSGASLDEVASRAGVTKPLLYRHFVSKADLYVVLLEEEMRQLRAGVATAVSEEDELEQRVRAGIDAFFVRVERRPFARRLLFRDPEAHSDVAAAHDRVQDEATRALAAALAAIPSLLPDAPDRELAIELFAQVVKTGLNGVASWWFANPDTSREVLVEHTMQMLWPGVRELLGPASG